MPVYQDQKTKKWYFRVYAPDIYGEKKQHKRKGFATKKEALQKEAEFKIQDKIGDCELTFEELWLDYKNFIENKMKYQSYRKTLSKFNNHILPFFKKFKLKNITSNAYIKWQNEIQQKGFKHKYNTSIHSSMVSILNYAVKFHGLDNNIASKVGNFTRKNDIPKKNNFWTLDEFKKFISVIPDKDFVYKVFYTTLYYTGLRQGECLALTWEDFNNNALSITKTISKEKSNGEYIINTPKTASSIRDVYIHDYLIQLLQELKNNQKKIIDFDDSWFIFNGISPLSPTTIGRKKDTYCELANIKKIRIHDFRHSHASLLLSNGLPITAISQRLGHSTISMTLNTYSHLLPSDTEKTINTLNKLL